jgi:Ca2+-dependent lipid-binding protein
LQPNLLVVDMEKIANNTMFSNMTSERTTAFAQDDKAPATAILHLNILDAKQLRTTDKNDPFVTITLGPSSTKTMVKKKSANPTWNEKFHLPIYNWDHPNILILRVHDRYI